MKIEDTIQAKVMLYFAAMEALQCASYLGMVINDCASRMNQAMTALAW